jgi:hypothetical protein
MQDAQISALVAKVESDFKNVAPAASGMTALSDSWRALVTGLALEAPPVTRACPSCKGTINREATRCLHCWAQSAPPEA